MLSYLIAVIVVYCCWKIFAQWEQIISLFEKSVTWQTVNFVTKGNIKKIAIIGAGSSGITAAKEALQAGFEVTVFEQTSEIGGNWYYREKENHSSVYKSTFINTSRQMMAYSDFPMPDSFPTFPHHKQLIRYFVDYAKHFGVTEKIKFCTQVIKIEPLEGERWRIHYILCKDGTPLYMKKGEIDTSNILTDEFDAVMVANGHHSVPRWPNPPFPGQDTYNGYMIHSHQYKDTQTGFNFNDKRVVILGIGNSAIDIANELSRCCEQVYLSTRTGAWIMPKYIGGKSIDHTGPFRFFLSIVPPKVALKLASFMLSRLIRSHQGDMKSWGLDPGVGPMSTHPTVSQEILGRIGHGTVRIKPNIKRIEKNSVVFSDDTRVDSDAIIFATGYQIRFDFIDNKILQVTDANEVSLYKYVFPINYPTLAVIGLIQPLGAIMPIAEMQSRWVSQYWQGNVGLPSKSDMEKDIQIKKDEMSKIYLKRARHTIQVTYHWYMDEIAELFRAKPSLFKHWSVWKELWFGQVVPFQYRLEGPGKWSGAEEALKKAHYTIHYDRPENVVT